MQIQTDIHYSSEELVRILGDVPISISGHGLKLEAHMVLGKFVYIEPIEGKVSCVTVHDITIENRRNDYLCFSYKDRLFEIRYE